MSTPVINEPRSRCWVIKFPWDADQITHGDLITTDLVHAKLSHAVQRCMVFVKFPSLKRSTQVSTLFPQPYAVVEPSTWGGYSSFKESPCDYELIIDESTCTPSDSGVTTQHERKRSHINQDGVDTDDDLVKCVKRIRVISSTIFELEDERRSIAERITTVMRDYI